MKNLELFVHVAHNAEPKQITVAETASVAELIEQLHRAGYLPREDGEEIFLFLDNGDEPLHHGHRLCDAGVGHRHLVHGHCCRRVEVKVHYNGVTKDRSFPPSARISRVLKWAAGAFGFTGDDAQGLELRRECNSAHPLPSDAHIGCYTQRHSCSVDLCLVAKIRVEG